MRTRLQASGTERDFALFNPAIDSKLRGCDLVITTVGDVAHSGSVLDGTVIVQNKTGRPVPFKITEQGRAAIAGGRHPRPEPAQVEYGKGVRRPGGATHP